MKKFVKCFSCNFVGVILIQKGQRVKYARCPGCGKVALR